MTTFSINNKHHKEKSAYQPFFTSKQIKGRRLIDTSGSQWDIGDTAPISINFELITLDNFEVLDQMKYVFAEIVKSLSPDSVRGEYSAVLAFLNYCDEISSDDFGEELAEDLSDELLNYFVSNRNEDGEDNLSRVRHWYEKGVDLKLPLFQKNVSNALKHLKLKGRVKGLDVLAYIPNKSPLKSDELNQLKNLLNKYSNHFEVGEANYWRLAATWLFITLGLRPKQLRLLMASDLAINVNSKTGHRTYILSVPSVKKRNAKARTYFKQRPIPVFLGERLEELSKYNEIQLSEFNIELSQVPLFLSSDLTEQDTNKRSIEYLGVLSGIAVSIAPDELLKKLNKLEKEEHEEQEKKYTELNLKINPRRLRKTFATHAAACGVEAMMLMELLDHEDMQHVSIYYQLGVSFAIKLDKVYREEFGDIFDFFKGKISLEELAETNKEKTVFGPANLRRLIGIGFCGKNALCRLAPPYSCYTCQKFEACADKELHEEVLGAMVEEIEELFEHNVAPGKFDMDHIRGCRSLIAQLEND
jgi:integrase